MTISRRQIFIFSSSLFSLLVLLVPRSTTGGLLIAAAAFLAVNLILTDLLPVERIIFPIYLVLTGAAGLVLRDILTLSVAFALQSALFFLGLWGVVYLTVLSINILNVATVRTVPLRRVALSFIYYLGVVLGIFLFFFLLTNFYRSFLAVFLLSGTVSVSLALPNFYFSQVEGVTGPSFGPEFRLRPGIHWDKLAVLTILMGQAALVLVFWPAQMFVRAVFLSGMLFLAIGFFQNVILKKTSRQILREFLVVWGGLFLMLILSRGG